MSIQIGKIVRKKRGFYIERKESEVGLIEIKGKQISSPTVTTQED